MKKLLLLFLALALTLPLASCGTGDQGGYSIVATNFAAYDFAREITKGVEGITVELLSGGDVHSFDPTFQDMAKLENADLFCYVGGDSDAAIDTLLQNTSQTNIFKLIDCVPLLEETVEDGEEHLHDEHVWTSPKNAVTIVRKLAERIIALDGDDEAVLRQNTEAYIEKLEALDQKFEALVEAQEKTVIFGDRFPLLYFADAYGLRYEAAFPSCHTTSEPSPTRVAELIALAKAENVTTVFHIEGGSHSVADRIAADIGGRTALFHACHKVTSDELAAGASYLSLMEDNYQALAEALS